MTLTTRGKDGVALNRSRQEADLEADLEVDQVYLCSITFIPKASAIGSLITHLLRTLIIKGKEMKAKGQAKAAKDQVINPIPCQPFKHPRRHLRPKQKYSTTIFITTGIICEPSIGS